MSIYSGPLNVLTDQSGSVIAVPLNPSDVPSGNPLIIDVSRLQPPSGSFGYIAGVTVDATAANVAAGIISLSFDGGYNLTRNANGGNTQVYKVSGPCQRITVTNLAWTTGTINVILWNTSPANELQSPLNVVATGTVTIGGTPTVQFAPGQSVNIGNISAGTVNISGVVTIEPGSHNIATTFFTNTDVNNVGNVSKHLVSSGTVGTIRSIFINGANVLTFKSGSVYFAIQVMDPSHLTTYAQGFLGITNTEQNYVNVLMLSMLAVPFSNGLDILITIFGGTVIVDTNFTLNCVVGWN